MASRFTSILVVFCMCAMSCATLCSFDAEAAKSWTEVKRINDPATARISLTAPALFPPQFVFNSENEGRLVYQENLIGFDASTSTNIGSLNFDGTDEATPWRTGFYFDSEDRTGTVAHYETEPEVVVLDLNTSAVICIHKTIDADVTSYAVEVHWVGLGETQSRTTISKLSTEALSPHIAMVAVNKDEFSAPIYLFVATWKQVDGKKTHLYASFYDGTAWSVPSQVEDDKAESVYFSQAVIDLNGLATLAWTALADDASVHLYTRQYAISSSAWTEAQKDWGTIEAESATYPNFDLAVRPSGEAAVSRSREVLLVWTKTPSWAMSNYQVQIAMSEDGAWGKEQTLWETPDLLGAPIAAFSSISRNFVVLVADETSLSLIARRGSYEEYVEGVWDHANETISNRVYDKNFKSVAVTFSSADNIVVLGTATYADSRSVHIMTFDVAASMWTEQSLAWDSAYDGIPTLAGIGASGEGDVTAVWYSSEGFFAYARYYDACAAGVLEACDVVPATTDDTTDLSDAQGNGSSTPNGDDLDETDVGEGNSGVPANGSDQTGSGGDGTTLAANSSQAGSCALTTSAQECHSLLLVVVGLVGVGVVRLVKSFLRRHYVKQNSKYFIGHLFWSGLFVR